MFGMLLACASVLADGGAAIPVVTPEQLEEAGNLARIKEQRGGQSETFVQLYRAQDMVAAEVTEATSLGERSAALSMIENLGGRRRRIRVAADKAYDERGFVARLRELGAVPQVAQYTGQRSSAIDGRTTRHAGYRQAQGARRHIEKIFGWLKQVGGQRRTRFRGRERVGWMFQFAAAAYNLIRMKTLIAAAE